MSVAVSGVNSSSPAVQAQRDPARVGVTHCAGGHGLLMDSAEAGRCEECKRWVFGKEKVMSCACCSCYYCSACAPQVRSGNDEHLWEDILSTLGSAMRDVERIKTQMQDQVQEIDFDFERFRSAFNCQSPGQETLSAEQIVVEHAYEQAKSVMTTCGAPTDLNADEEVIDHRADFQAHTPAEEIVQTPHLEPDQASVASGNSSREEPTDLLDLSNISTPMEVISPLSPTGLMPVKSDPFEPAVIAPPKPREAPPTDLLDLSLHDEADEVAVVSSMPVEAVAPVPLDDLLDLSEMPATQGEAVGGIAQDLLNLSLQPDTATITDEAVGIAAHQQSNLQDIVDVDVKLMPAAAPAVHDLADLLDFGEQPKA